MTREEAINILNRDDDSMRKGYFCINDFKAIEVLKSQEPFDIETYCKEHFCVMVDKDVWEKAEKALKQEKIGHCKDCRECKAEHDCYECKKYTESEES